ncbi:DNA methyltransferase [Sinorhizobium chiapasense]
MEPKDFIQKWSNSSLKERAAAQEHFLDLCRLLGEPTPAEADPSGLDYGFEVGATKTTGGKGFADVFKRGYFAWEYKGTKANLDTAFAQLQRYAVALDNPPLLVVSDIGSAIRIHTNWTNSISKVYEISISDLGDTEKRAWLKAVFSDPDALRPKKTRQQLTEEVAGDFAKLARSLRERGHAPEPVAHFINRLVFCMFAEDVKLLPDSIFSRMLDRALEEPGEFEAFARDLFIAMKGGGRVGFERIAWFNGGLFDDDLVISLTRSEIKIVRDAAAQYWGDIDPSILGTLFERGLDPDKRSQLGAHYTDREKIMMIINPVVVEPLALEWEIAKTKIAALMENASAGKGGAKTKSKNQAQAVLDGYLKRLADFRVLDPACGSGNFLYLALRALKDMEHRAQVEAEALGLPRSFPRIGPEVVNGIELNPYAAELARVSVWVGEIQWMLKNGFAASQNPILKPLNNIECRDALMSLVEDDGIEKWEEADWPEAEAIIGNPPFLGRRSLRRDLTDAYVDVLYRVYSGQVPQDADLVAYWVKKAEKAIASGGSQRAGLVTTNSIRSGANRRVLEDILKSSTLLAAWPDEPWTNEGAAVRVSIVVFGRASQGQIPQINGTPVAAVNPDLTGSAINFASSRRLSQNIGVSFIGIQKNGPFDIDGATARQWLQQPLNVNGRPNADVIRPQLSGTDVARERLRDRWIVDFGHRTGMVEASMFEKPFSFVEKFVKPTRAETKRRWRRENWWLFGETMPAFRASALTLPRYIGTSLTSRHRIFIWVYPPVIVDSTMVAIARDDATSFGILHSRIHELWSRRLGNWMGVGNDSRYTPTTTFETFPFPNGLTPDVPAANYSDDARARKISEAAKRLDELRENWLNPPDLVRREPEVVTGYPSRIVPVNEKAAILLKKRTLTTLYNERPTWLDHAHKAIDDAVAEAYGWPTDLADEEILDCLFALNQARS